MPVPLISPTEISLSEAIESALIEANAIQPLDTAKQVLNSCGASLEQTVTQLANLSLTARDSVRHAAIRDILDIHGIQFRKDSVSDVKPSITFNISAENVQANLSSMFDPQRG